MCWGWFVLGSCSCFTLFFPYIIFALEQVSYDNILNNSNSLSLMTIDWYVVYDVAQARLSFYDDNFICVQSIRDAFNIFSWSIIVRLSFTLSHSINSRITSCWKRIYSNLISNKILQMLTFSSLLYHGFVLQYCRMITMMAVEYEIQFYILISSLSLFFFRWYSVDFDWIDNVLLADTPTRFFHQRRRERRRQVNSIDNSFLFRELAC